MDFRLNDCIYKLDYGVLVCQHVQVEEFNPCTPLFIDIHGNIRERSDDFPVSAFWWLYPEVKLAQILDKESDFAWQCVKLQNIFVETAKKVDVELSILIEEAVDKEYNEFVSIAELMHYFLIDQTLAAVSKVLEDHRSLQAQLDELARQLHLG